MVARGHASVERWLQPPRLVHPCSCRSCLPGWTSRRSRDGAVDNVCLSITPHLAPIAWKRFDVVERWLQPPRNPWNAVARGHASVERWLQPPRLVHPCSSTGLVPPAADGGRKRPLVGRGNHWSFIRH